MDYCALYRGLPNMRSSARSLQHVGSVSRDDVLSILVKSQHSESLRKCTIKSMVKLRQNKHWRLCMERCTCLVNSLLILILYETKVRVRLGLIMTDPRRISFSRALSIGVFVKLFDCFHDARGKSIPSVGQLLFSLCSRVTLFDITKLIIHIHKSSLQLRSHGYLLSIL